MPKRMLIDASHPEETRVVVLDGQKVEEFDFEAASKRPLKGNIYLAKVTRVEPSLQAAFVEYGGNRQGFLAFSEIHPDYYQIPVADRLALLAEQEAEARRRAEDEFESFETATAPAPSASLSEIADAAGESVAAPSEEGFEHDEDESEDGEFDADAPEVASVEMVSPPEPTIPEASIPEDTIAAEVALADESGANDSGEFASGESITDEQDVAIEKASAQQNEVADERDGANRSQPLQQRPTQRWMRRRHYKIQEVIKRRQVILVQVVKEERGNKGAALTTYLSLAGRYCVLMPNTPRGGGISRKITNANDRKRLKSAAQALELPEGMGLIIRTAGENRTKVEIKRDYEYLLRMWDTIRDITLKSNAPACVYEEGDLIKRAIRDLYNKDVSEIVVEGEDGYRNAKDFMRMLMPSHAKNVKVYKEPVPLYQRLHIEAQLDAMFSPTVTLRSGGYIVINQTEALVAIDVNSGRATREHSIEDTAYKTNLEAAEEIGRQLRLRDLAGLIVIDFIDMEDARNDRNVEKRLRDCVKNDRARVQIGKISQFGLLEMSRQRLRAGVVAGSTVVCPTCNGQGIVRSVESTALRVLRSLDEEGQRQRANALVVHAPVEVAMYTLNQKRREIARMEQDYGITISFQPKDEMQAGTFELERIGQRLAEERVRTAPAPEAPPPAAAEVEETEVIEAEDVESEEDVAHEPAPASGEQHPNGEGGGRRRRRRRRRGRDRGQQHPHGEPQHAHVQTSHESESDAGDDEQDGDEAVPAVHAERSEGATNGQPGEGGGRRRRRRRRRGRRGQRDGQGYGAPEGAENGAHSHDAGSAPAGEYEHHDIAAPNAPSAPVWSLHSEAGHEPAEPQHETPAQREAEPARFAEPIANQVDVTPPARTPTPSAAREIEPESEKEPEPVASSEPASPPRRGWWQRPFKLRE